MIITKPTVRLTLLCLLLVGLGISKRCEALDKIHFEPGDDTAVEYVATVTFVDGTGVAPVEQITVWSATALQGLIPDIQLSIQAVDANGAFSEQSNWILVPVSADCRMDLNHNAVVDLPDLMALHGKLGNVCLSNLPE